VDSLFEGHCPDCKSKHLIVMMVDYPLEIYKEVEILNKQ